MFEQDYKMFKAYANSKLALLMFAEELQHRLSREKSKVIVNSANPGESLSPPSRPRTEHADITRRKQVIGSLGMHADLRYVLQEGSAGGWDARRVVVRGRARRGGGGVMMVISL